MPRIKLMWWFVFIVTCTSVGLCVHATHLANVVVRYARDRPPIVGHVCIATYLISVVFSCNVEVYVNIHRIDRTVHSVAVRIELSFVFTVNERGFK